MHYSTEAKKNEDKEAVCVCVREREREKMLFIFAENNVAFDFAKICK